MLFIGSVKPSPRQLVRFRWSHSLSSSTAIVQLVEVRLHNIAVDNLGPPLRFWCLTLLCWQWMMYVPSQFGGEKYPVFCHEAIQWSLIRHSLSCRW